MKKNLVLLCLSLFAAELYSARAHDHLEAGIASTSPGAPLVFVNDADFGGDTGFVFALSAGGSTGPYAGYYYTGDVVLAALAATPDDGGPEPGAAGLGAQIQAQLLGVEGPRGSSFGFWETTQDDVDSTNLTWSVPVPYSSGTNLILVSQNDGSPGADPYGHLHGRIFSVTKPGLYKITWRFVDTSTNGPKGGPVQAPSAPFSLYFQADFTIGSIARGTNSSIAITFAAPSNIPDSGIGPATNYQLQSSPVIGTNAVWKAEGGTVVGDDHLHLVSVPTTTLARFFRLTSD